VVDVARRAVTVTPQVGAVGAGVFAGLLHGALYSQALHIFIGGYLGVYVVTLKYLR
jgi:hypothetical protein